MSALTRAVRAELVKLPWRHPWWTVMIPLAVVIPVFITVAIAQATQSNLLRADGGMDTNNAAYWIIVFSTFILMLGGVTSTCNEFRDRTVDAYIAISPRRWVLPVAKLVTFGISGVIVTFVVTLLVMLVLPGIYPDVWGRVDVFSADGIRLLIGLPILTLLVCTLGIGLSVLVRKAGFVVMIVLLWKFGVELFVAYIPGEVGMLLQKLSPFKNGELGAGQMASFDSLFGNSVGSLVYFGLICAAFFVIALIRFSRTDVPTT